MYLVFRVSEGWSICGHGHWAERTVWHVDEKANEIGARGSQGLLSLLSAPGSVRANKERTSSQNFTILGRFLAHVFLRTWDLRHVRKHEGIGWIVLSSVETRTINGYIVGKLMPTKKQTTTLHLCSSRFPQQSYKQTRQGRGHHPRPNHVAIGISASSVGVYLP